MKYQVQLTPQLVFCLTVEGDSEADAIEAAEEKLRDLLFALEEDGDIDWVDKLDEPMDSEAQALDSEESEEY
jgi:hypothetical protein